MIIVPGCRILIDPVKDETSKRAEASGFILPEMDDRRRQANVDQGRVLEIGPKASEDYIQGVEVGSLIGFTKFGGKFVTDPETKKELLIINDEDVICIIKE